MNFLHTNGKIGMEEDHRPLPISLLSLLGEGPPELCNIGYEGKKLQAKKIVQIGLRDLDEGEKELIRSRGIHAYTMADVDKKGMARVMEEAIEITVSEALSP